MSLKPQPSSKVSILIDEINLFLETQDFSEFDLKRLKKESEKVKKNVAVADGFGLLGTIACLENDIDAMRSYFKRAIQQSGGHPLYINNYAACLFYLNLYKDAYEYALKAYEKDRSYLEALDFLIEMTCVLNKKDEFEKYTSAWYKLIQKEHDLKTSVLYNPINRKEYYAFLKKYSDKNALPSDHLPPKDILGVCSPAIARIFGTPISVLLEIMHDPESNAEPELVAFIQWFGDMEDGMKRYDQFENWYIENDYNLKTELVVFSIELVGE